MAAGSYHHGALHEAILAASLAEARSGGPQAIQIRALAKKVGVSPSAVYRHVPSIDVLIAEVAQLARKQLAARIVAERDRAPARRTRKAQARERFRAMGRGYVAFAVSEPQLFDTAFFPTSASPPHPEERSAWSVLIEGVADLVDAGVVRPGAAADAALIAWSGVHGIASILVRRALVEPIPEDSAVDVVVDGLMRAIESL